MDLRSENPYWLLQHGIIKNYPSLDKSITTDIVIMGGGISGALTAWYLTKAGFRVVLTDRRHIGMGSTAASTCLLQYEIDTPLHKLIDMVGEDHAVKSYLLCRKAIDDIEEICGRTNCKDIFARRPSFQYASFQKDIKSLEEEFRLRKKNGISLRWLEAKEIKEKFAFEKSAGLLSADGAEVDAYALTHSLLDSLGRSAQVYDHTAIEKIRYHKKSVELRTGDGKIIKARKLVIACGYESQKYIPFKVQQLASTFAIVSEPFARKDFWYKNALIWETKTPYLYLRTTKDNRIIIGGKDVPLSDPILRDRMLTAKARALENEFSKLFPGIPFKTDFKWAGSFASTKDGLPFIGSIRQRPHTYFALGFGGNGITFSALAGQIIRDIINGKKNEGADIFSFNR